MVTTVFNVEKCWRKRVVVSSVAVSLVLVLGACGGGPTGSGATVTSDASSGAASTRDVSPQPALASSVTPSDSTSAESRPAGDTNDNDVGSGSSTSSEDGDLRVQEPNYEADAGRTLKEYDYDEDIQPADSIVATLCNLNREYLQGLSPGHDGEEFPGDQLRMATLSLGDNVSIWDSVKFDYPEVEQDIATTAMVHDLWSEALVAADNNDLELANDLLREADQEIQGLPESLGSREVTCQ